jgi:cyclophilin family peptidyl-prolyl cis-trans isomerase
MPPGDVPRPRAAAAGATRLADSHRPAVRTGDHAMPRPSAPLACLFTSSLLATLVLACGGSAGTGGAQDAAAGTQDATGGQDAASAQDATGGVDAAGGQDAASAQDAAGGAGDAADATAAPAGDPALAACDEFIAGQAVKTDVPGWKTRLNQPPKFPFDGEAQYLWHLTTNKGPITVRLWPDVAPMHVSSTIYLTRLGFYDGITFHRVIPGFMAQGGCPLGSGSGGPGYKYAGEFKSSVRHDRPFLLSMANAGAGTDGSQFFLTFAATPWLDGKHTLFGEIVAGGESMSALERAGTREGRPTEPLAIESARIEVKPKEPS